MEPEAEPALISAIKHNDITIVTDLAHDHTGMVEHVKKLLSQAKSENLTDILIEADPKQRSIEEIKKDGEFGKMVSEVERLGIRIHLMDDTSIRTAINQKYPEQAKFLAEQDPYLKNRKKVN